jgi:dienelactone hydrolase
MAIINEHFLSGGQRVPLEVFVPAAAGKHPIVLVLHGSFGLQPPYRADIVSFAEALASSGIAAAIPHYLEATGSASLSGDDVMNLIPSRRPVWRQACGDALISMAKDARFDPSRLGMLGFSLGANLALSLAMDPPGGTTV